METTFEITPSELRMNEKLIKRARRWIIAALVWGILVSIAGGYIVPNVMGAELWSKYHPIYYLCANLIFIAFAYFGLWPLRKHTLLRFRQFSVMLFFALCGDRILVIVIQNMFGWLLPSEYWLSIGPSVLWLVVALFLGYLCCAAYSFLCRNKEIEIAYRPAFYLLCIALFIEAMGEVAGHAEVIVRRSLEMSSNALSLYSDFEQMLNYVLLLLHYVAVVIFVIGYKRLFATPSAFPAEDDGVDYDSIWKPSRMTTGFLVSMLLFIALLYLMVRTVFFQQ